MQTYLAPSIMCADLLNLQKEIEICTQAKADLIHFDIMDTTFTTTTMLPPALIPAIRKVTAIPLDIHVMIDRPERILQTLLPLCKDAYVSFHIEVTKEIQNLLKEVRSHGGKPCVALNPGTPVCMIEEVLPIVDMVLVMTCNAAHGAKQDIDVYMQNKIRRVRSMLDAMQKPETLIEVDGNISFANAKIAKECGANVFVLGSSSIYGKPYTVAEGLAKLRSHLQD